MSPAERARLRAYIEALIAECWQWPGPGTAEAVLELDRCLEQLDREADADRDSTHQEG